MSCARSLALWTLAALVSLLLVACGGGAGGNASALPAPACNVASTANPVGMASNALHLVVDSGPTCTEVNRLYASVTVCQPGNAANCQTIDHVLVDTGSTGLRVFANVLSPALALPRVNGSTGRPLFSCAQFVDDSYAFGPVAVADIKLSGETAASAPIQVIADPAFSSLGGACSPSGSALSSASVLGANGIIGLGFFKEDCGLGCTNNTNNGFYYTCTSNACTGITGDVAANAKQIKNPVALFATNNNGLTIDLPVVNLSGAPSASGTLTFGIGTQANNAPPGGASVMTTTPVGNIGTLFQSQSMNASFIDTGSNGLYFGVSAFPLCTGGFSSFYCPVSRTVLGATLFGANAASKAVVFTIDNVIALFTPASVGLAVFPTMSGPIGNNNIFDWGLPFFFGRKVVIGIEGSTSALGTGPLIAF
jgi:hypothetical protein